MGQLDISDCLSVTDITHDIEIANEFASLNHKLRYIRHMYTDTPFRFSVKDDIKMLINGEDPNNLRVLKKKTGDVDDTYIVYRIDPEKQLYVELEFTVVLGYYQVMCNINKFSISSIKGVKYNKHKLPVPIINPHGEYNVTEKSDSGFDLVLRLNTWTYWLCLVGRFIFGD